MARTEHQQQELFEVAASSGRPVLQWHGKRPLQETPYYPPDCANAATLITSSRRTEDTCGVVPVWSMLLSGSAAWQRPRLRTWWTRSALAAWDRDSGRLERVADCAGS